MKSDHVVTIYQVGEDRGVPFLAMELLQGETLEQRLRRGERPAADELLRLARETALGLAAAHDRGLIHRDVKPANIWLEAPSGRVKILDFGLARAAESDAQVTQPGGVVGTPAYMAPEQARGETVDHRADLFGLGCVLYRTCTGQPPFPGKTAMAVLAALALQAPPPLGELRPDLPPALCDLVMRLLAKDAADRPPSARAVAEDIARIERGASAATVPGTRRRRLLAGAALVVLAGALAATVVIIRDKYGKEVARVTVPEGGSVEVKPVGATDKAADDATREVAEWVLRLGGKVTLAEGEQPSARSRTCRAGPSGWRKSTCWPRTRASR